MVRPDPRLAMLEPPRGYLTLAWLGLAVNSLAIPLTVAVILADPTWKTAHIAVGAGGVLPMAVVGIVGSVALLKWRAWGQILAIVALAMGLALGVPYGIVRLVLLSEGRWFTAAVSALLWIAMTAALVYWCRPSIRRYLA
ncbi:MAG: Hepatitis C virus core protein [Cyanobium sp.]|nr:Hepatitis C virus core protein [Cyanobium sp.]